MSLGVVLASASSIARADQCAYVSAKEAERAAAILKRTKEMVEYCELCNGEGPKLTKIHDVKVTIIDPENREVTVNGQGIDLAYVFVPQKEGSHEYQNLAKLSKCNATGVSAVITYPSSKTK